MSYIAKTLHSFSAEIATALDRRDITPAEALGLRIQLIKIDTLIELEDKKIEIGQKVLGRLQDLEVAVDSVRKRS